MAYDLPIVTGVELRLEQVLLHLLLNRFEALAEVTSGAVKVFDVWSTTRGAATGRGLSMTDEVKRQKRRQPDVHVGYERNEV